ncbi:MAG TPA: CocE/NonD family hydrolase [Nocardioidaceae bacterium]|nr:CocE/NonD family hydrolase [Nocardioidaceae bacterium]
MAHRSARTTTVLLTGLLTGLATVLAGLAGSLAAGLAGVSPDAQAAGRRVAYRLQHIHVDVRLGPDGDHACTISADLYTPAGVDRRHRAPAILTTHGFGGSKDDAKQRATARGFVREGYVVLSYSGLGFGGSGCKIHLDDPAWDGKAGRQLVSVLAGRHPYTDDATGRQRRVRTVARERGSDIPHDPKVGMIGGSYGGQVQYAVAMQDRRVDALIPIITWNDLSYSLAPNNTGLARGVTYRTPGVHKRLWTDLFFGLGIVDGIDDAQVDPRRNVGCPNFVDAACTALAELETLGYPTPATLRLARHASVARYARRVHAPTLLVQGQNDTLFNLQEAVATYRALRRSGTPVRMVWQSWGHSGGTPAPGELDLTGGSLRDSYLGRRFLAWMDHYVRGRDRAPVGPRFAYFRDWVDYDTRPRHAGHAVAGAYVTRARFSQKATAALYLSGVEALVARRSAVRRGTASYANASVAPTSYSETSGLEGSVVNRPPADDAGTFAAWTSPPLRRGVAMVGSPRLTVHLDAPVAAAGQRAGAAGRLILFAKVYDVAPDGTVHLQHRLVSPVRVHDVTAPVHVQLPAVVQRFAPGHRIRLVLAASDFAYAGNPLPQPVTVRTGRARPGVLRLPLTGPLRFQRP